MNDAETEKKPNPPQRPRWSPGEYLDHVANRVPEYLQESAYSALWQVEIQWDDYQSAMAAWRGRLAAWSEARARERGHA